MAEKTQQYRVLTGLNYGPKGKRAEPGDVVGDLPADSLGWLIEQGHVEPVTEE